MLKARVLRAIEAHLTIEPACYKLLATKVFAVDVYVCRLLKQLHRDGRIHIVGWIDRRPVYRWGAGEDAAWVSRAVTPKDRKRKSRANMDVATKDFLAARRRQQRRTIKIDPLMAAFFGVKR